MPQWALGLLEIYGPGTVVTMIVVMSAFFLSKAFSQQVTADANKDVTMTGFAVKFDDERRMWQERHDASNRQWQERHDKLEKEFTEFRIVQAKKEGGLEVLEKMLTTERTERRVERDEFQDQLRKLDTRVLEVEKNNQIGLDKIRELEAERDGLKKEVADRDSRIVILETDNLEQKTTIEHLTNKANTLSELVERLQNVTPTPVMNTTQPIPALESVEDTFVPETKSAVSTAEEQT